MGGETASSASMAAASSGGIAYSNSLRVRPRIGPLMVRKARSPATRAARVLGQIALHDAGLGLDGVAPGVTFDQEFAFDFGGH